MKTFIIILTVLISTVSMSQNNITPLVEVTGEGIVKVVPDEVTINVRAENTGKNAKELKQLNDNIINDVLKFLRSQGIEDKYVKTEYVRLGKSYDYNTKTYNYTANQSVSIKLIDLKRYEAIMDGLMEGGINRIDNVVFSSSRQDELASEARKKAVANAKMKAEEYVGELGQSIGKAITIRENVSSNVPSPVYRAMAMDAGGAEKQTLAPGEMSIRVMIYISFELN